MNTIFTFQNWAGSRSGTDIWTPDYNQTKSVQINHESLREFVWFYRTDNLQDFPTWSSIISDLTESVSWRLHPTGTHRVGAVAELSERVHDAELSERDARPLPWLPRRIYWTLKPTGTHRVSAVAELSERVHDHGCEGVHTEHWIQLALTGSALLQNLVSASTTIAAYAYMFTERPLKFSKPNDMIKADLYKFAQIFSISA